MPDALRWTAALSLGLAAACGTGTGKGEESARASLERDLTLRSAGPPLVQVASPVELGRPEPPRVKTPRRRSVPKPAPAPSERPPRPEATPSPEPVAVAAPVAVAVADLPAPAELAPVGNGRELAPGETVTMIPASSGPSTGSDDIGLPAETGRGLFKGGAGRCPHPPRGGSGRPVGIARWP